MSSSEHGKSGSESSYEKSDIEEEESEYTSLSENYNEEEEHENASGEESEKFSENSEPDILNSEDDADSLSDDFETQLKKFNNNKLVEQSEIKFDIPKEKDSKYITIAKNSDKNISILNVSNKNSEKSMDSIFDKFVAFKILNDVNSNLDKLEKELNENLKKMKNMQKDDKQKVEKSSKTKKEKFEDDLSDEEDDSSSEEEEKIKIQKYKKFSDKEVNTDVIGSRTAGNFKNDFKDSLYEINQNNSGNNQKFKNYERNRNNNYNNSSNNHFRTIQDLYRNPYHNTQPIIYNRDNNNSRNSKGSGMNFNKNTSREEIEESQNNYIKIQKKNRPQNITHAMDILLKKNSEQEQGKNI